MDEFPLVRWLVTIAVILGGFAGAAMLLLRLWSRRADRPRLRIEVVSGYWSTLDDPHGPLGKLGPAGVVNLKAINPGGRSTTILAGRGHAKRPGRKERLPLNVYEPDASDCHDIEVPVGSAKDVLAVVKLGQWENPTAPVTLVIVLEHTFGHVKVRVNVQPTRR